MRALILAAALAAFATLAQAEEYDCEADPATMSREQTTHCLAKDLSDLMDTLRELQDALDDLDNQ